MAAGKKVLVGCGIGCGLVLLVALGAGGLGVWWVSDTMQGFNRAVDLRQELESSHGLPAGFRPAADGAVSPERMEAFLAVREATQPARRSCAATLANLPLAEADARRLEEAPLADKLRSVFRIGGSALGMIGTLGDFFAARNKALLEQDLGLGEYTYIYLLAYHAWLGHPPDDGPGRGHGGGTRFGPSVEGRLRRDMRIMIENQLAAVDASGAPDPEWRRALVEEIEKLDDGRADVPWMDGLPEAIAASFEPYRERLEATYSPATHPFELARNERRNRLSIQAR